MLMLLIMMATTIEVRRDGPALSLDHAQESTPAQLGDALLAPGHPPIVEASVGPEGIMPATAPGMPVTSEIRLYTAAEAAPTPGFCRKTKITVTLEPVMPDGRRLPPARAATASSTALYRWAARSNDATGCEADHSAFFALDPALADRSFAVIRLLARLRDSAVHRIPVTIDDQEGRSMREYFREHPSEARDMPEDVTTPIVDARTALRMFPISSITTIVPYERAWPRDILKPSDLRGGKDRPLEAITMFAGGAWHAAIVLDGDRITTVRFVRAIPPPF